LDRLRFVTQDPNRKFRLVQSGTTCFNLVIEFAGLQDNP
jgi:hypothetical protein